MLADYRGSALVKVAVKLGTAINEVAIGGA
jgi:hypothetical protein